LKKSKLQVPSPKESPNFKFHNATPGVEVLELEISLELGTWDLELIP
jgi:hypothetical protein